MKKRQAMLISVISGLATFIQAEDTPGTYIRDYSIIPPSPEVSALLEYSAPEVDYCTGQPIINIPVFTLREGTLSLPISFNYASGGLKLAQEPATAGAGWELSASAVVARTVYGKPDEAKESGVMGLMNLNADSKKLLDYIKNLEADHDVMDQNFLAGEYYNATVWGCDYYDGKADMANDVFQISGLGLGATFAYDYNSTVVKPVVSSRNGIKITSSHPINTLKYNVTDANGLHYSFGEREFTDFVCYTGSPELTQTETTIRYVSAWHLTEYYNDNGDTIHLRYTERPERHNTGNSQVSYTVLNEYISNRIPNRISSTGAIKYYPKVLSEIESSTFIVSFEYASRNFSDILSKIKIIPKNGDRTALRTIELMYGHPFQTIMAGSSFSRCFLTKIIDNGHTIYEFDYYTNDDFDIGPDSAPYWGDCDFGGFYNHADNGTNRIPTVNNHNSGGADRSVNPIYAVFGSLKSIRYGTGGSTDFVWEPHQIGFVNDIPVSSTGDDSYYTLQATDTLSAVVNGKKELTIQVSSHNMLRLDLTHYFDMAESNYMVPDYFNEHSTDFISHYPRVAFYDNNSVLPGLTYYLDYKTIKERYHNEPFYLPVTPGTYTVKLEYPTEINGAQNDLEREFNSGMSVAGRVYIEKYIAGDAQVDDSNKKLWCGLRIKRMTSNSVSESIHKDFFYSSPDYCEGVAQSLPRFDYQWHMGAMHPGILGIAWAEVFSIGDVGLIRTPSGIPPVQYNRVITKLSRSDPNYPDSYLSSIRTRHEFTTSRNRYAADYNNSAYLNFQPPGARMNTSRSHMRGLPIAEATTDAGGNTVAETKRTFNIYEQDNTPVFTTDLFVITDFSGVAIKRGRAAKMYGIGQYTITPYTQTVASEHRTDGHGVSSLWKYEYFHNGYTGDIDFALRRSASTVSSSGHEEKIYYTYRPMSAGYSPDVEVTLTTSDGRITGGSRKEYDGNTSRILRTFTASRRGGKAESIIPPTQATTAALKNLFAEPEYTYTYDDSGRLAQISLRGTVLASYLWGYNGLYPVIEAKSIPYETLKSAAGSIASTGGNESQRIAALGTALRNQFPEKEILTVSYHWLFGMATITDGRGLKRSFEYDDLGRLTSVSDFNNYLIERYEYSTHLSTLD